MLQKRTSTKILCFLPSALTPALESCSWSTAEHIASNNLFMNLAPEFLSWIHRGVLLSNLKSRLTLPQPGTSASQEKKKKKKSQQPDILYQGKSSAAIYERREEKSKIFREKHANNNRAVIKATYLPSDRGGIVKRELQRILIVFSCGPDGGTLWAAVRRDDGVCKLIKKLLPWHTILDIQTKLPPPTLCAREFFGSFAWAKSKKKGGKKKDRDPFVPGNVSEIRYGIPEMTHKSQRARGCSLTPFCRMLVIHHHTMRTGKQP